MGPPAGRPLPPRLLPLPGGPVSPSSLALMAALWLVALAAAAPLLDAPVYWDESVHYQTARHGTPADERFTDIWGNPLNSPTHLFWQRPAWYAAFWLPAQGDLHTFRVVHAVLAATLAPIAFAVARAHGLHRATATAAGLAVAILPPLPVWAAYGFMDPMMAACLGLAALQRVRGRWSSSAAWAVLAVWMKETALLFVAGAAAVELARGWLNGRFRLWPLEASRREATALYAVLLAPLPLVYGWVRDVPLPGGVAYHPTSLIVDTAWGTPWLLLPLAAGLLWRRSRPLAIAGLALGGTFVALQLLGRSTESWYLVPALLFAVLGAAAGLEAFLRWAWLRRAPLRAAALAAAVAAVGVVGAMAAVPDPGTRALLFPAGGHGPADLATTSRHETTVRDQDHLALVAGLGEHPTVLLVEPGWPPPYVLFAHAEHVYLDLAFVRAVVGFDAHALADRIETNGTSTVVYNQVHPMTRAITEVYADCITARHGGITVLEGTACPGRGLALAEANHRLGGP